MRANTLAVAFFVAAAAFGGSAACSSEPVTGTVVELEHEPAKADTYKRVTDCDKNKSGNQPCRKIDKRGHGERWYVDLDTDGDGVEDHDDLSISRAEYNRLRSLPNGGVGSSYTWE